MNEIINGIYWVGVFNPNMRIFDIIMSTKYGTSYNAYLIKDKQNVLIDTTHNSYCEQFFKNIEEVMSVKDITYLVVNHCEPDHSGCIQKVMSINPNIIILCSQASAFNLKKICNNDRLNIRVVKHNEEINIGSRTLRFIIAPFLHWPDTMFTYIEKDKTIFTCDFLGTHYCEPYVFDYKMNQKHLNAFYSEVKNYYDAIFSPFTNHVIYGLEQLKKLDIDYACVSHGPILTQKCELPKIINKYKEWSVVTKCDCIPIFYASAYRYTAIIAKAIASGISAKLPKIEVTLFDINEYPIDKLVTIINKSQYFGIGSPTLNRSVVAPIVSLLVSIDGINSSNKHAFAFGSYGWSGEAVDQINQYLKSLRIQTFNEGFKVKFLPSQEELNKAKQFGEDFAAIIDKDSLSHFIKE